MNYLFRYLALFAACMPVSVFAQSQGPISFYTYYNYADHQGIVLNPPQACDSLRFISVKNKKIAQDELTCLPLDTLNGELLKLTETSGVVFSIDGAGNIYARGSDNLKERMFVSKPPIRDSTQSKVVQVFEDSENRLDICYTPWAKYRIGAKKPTGSNCIHITIDDIVLAATGRLSETKKAILAEQITFWPEDRKIQDTLIINVPTGILTENSRLFGYIYDMKGNVIRLQIGLKPGENLIFRETLLPGTYKFLIMLDEHTELLRKLIFMLPPPKLHEEE